MLGGPIVPKSDAASVPTKADGEFGLQAVLPKILQQALTFSWAQADDMVNVSGVGKECLFVCLRVHSHQGVFGHHAFLFNEFVVVALVFGVRCRSISMDGSQRRQKFLHG